MNSRKFRIAIIIILIQALVIIGVVVATRVQYPESLGYIDEVPWEMMPTVTKRIIRDTPTKTIEPIRALFELENCTYPSEVILNQLSDIEEFEVDVWIGRQKYTKDDAISIINGDSGTIYRDLFFQLYTTKINIQLGVNASLIEIEVYEAETFISEYDPDVTIEISDLQDAVRVTSILNDFNNGVIGPGLCGRITAVAEDSPTPTLLFSTSTKTPTPQDTSTSTLTPTPSPTPTFTNTPYIVVRTSTPIPTKTEKPDKPTDEPPPPTKVPPTEAPTDEPIPTNAP